MGDFRPPMKEGDICPRCKEQVMRKLARRSDGKPFLGCSGFRTTGCNYSCDIIVTASSTNDHIKSLETVIEDLRRRNATLMLRVKDLQAKLPSADSELPYEDEIPF